MPQSSTELILFPTVQSSASHCSLRLKFILTSKPYVAQSWQERKRGDIATLSHSLSLWTLNEPHLLSFSPLNPEPHNIPSCLSNSVKCSQWVPHPALTYERQQAELALMCTWYMSLKILATGSSNYILHKVESFSLQQINITEITKKSNKAMYF